LDLIDGLIKWGLRKEALRELKALEAVLPKAREKLAGQKWAASWADWNRRLAQDKRKLGAER